MTNPTNNNDDRITEQFLRETSEHFMSELKKKDKIINFLKDRLREVSDEKAHFLMLTGKIKMICKLQKDMMNLSFNQYYDIADELKLRTNNLDDTTRSLDSDIIDFLENYADLDIEELEVGV